MTQPPAQGSGSGPEGSDQPTQSFGYPEGEQPTRSFPAQAERQGHDQPAADGDPSGPAPEQPRRSAVPIVVGVIVAALVIAGLIFAGIRFLGDDSDPVAGPDPAEETEQTPAEQADPGQADPEDADPEDADQLQDDGAATQEEGSQPDGELGGELYDYLTSVGEAVEGDLGTWIIDDPGWQRYDDVDIDPAESYTATFTSSEDDSLTMWAVRLEDVDATAQWAQSLVDERGEADDTGQVWTIEDEDSVEDDLQYGVYHMWQDGSEIEVLWWDDTGVVRHVSGPDEPTWDFYMSAPI